MYLIMIGSYGLALFLGALLYKYITDRGKARKRSQQRTT